MKDLTSLTAKDQESERKVKMLVTHVHKMPEGAEKREFLVVDMLNINHLRVRHIGESTFIDKHFGVFYDILIILCDPPQQIFENCA